MPLEADRRDRTNTIALLVAAHAAAIVRSILRVTERTGMTASPSACTPSSQRVPALRIFACLLAAGAGTARAEATPPAVAEAPVAVETPAAPTATPTAAPARPVTFKLAGRVHWDVARFDDDARGAGNTDASELRAAWIDVSGKFFGADYKFEVDASGDEVVAKDAYIARRFTGGVLTVGQFKQYVTLDDRISGNHTVFIERSFLTQALAPTYRLGAGWLTSRDGYTLAASAYSLESIDAWQVKGRALAVRGTYAPRREAGDVLHLGLSLAHEAYDHPGADGAPALRLRSRPVGLYGDASRATLVDFSGGNDVDVDKYALELAGVRGAWSYQGELGGARYDDGAGDARLATGYAQLAWLVTGEVRPYDGKAGRFGRIQPKGRAGAWELALRYDWMRGRQPARGATAARDAEVGAWTAGVNWYPRPHLRVMLDWVDSRSRDRRNDRTLDRTGALLARAQFDF